MLKILFEHERSICIWVYVFLFSIIIFLYILKGSQLEVRGKAQHVDAVVF